MALSSQEAAFVQRIQSRSHALGETLRELYELQEIYADRTYSAIADEGLADAEITAANLSSAINMIAELKKLFGNQVVLQGDWGAVLNVIRRL